MNARLKLGAIPDEKPVRLSVELAAETHRMLLAYSEALQKETGQPVEPARLVGPMLARFMASDRAFGRRRQTR
jgi:hypothetical protein